MGKTATDPELRAKLERRARAGEWLTASELATLFDVNRGTIHRWRVDHGLLRWRQNPVGGRSPIEHNPIDVVKLLDQQRQEHRGRG